MRNKIAAALLVASIAIPSYAAVKADPDRRSGADRSAITRVVELLRRLIGIGVNDGGEVVIPKP
ncbi:MAG TPA: hypothetical protein VJ032_05855 [Thermoanaerobaculia bacterium]|nr:hypothetical protein [Thermoanaerobaculia bacterium]